MIRNGMFSTSTSSPKLMEVNEFRINEIPMIPPSMMLFGKRNHSIATAAIMAPIKTNTQRTTWFVVDINRSPLLTTMDDWGKFMQKYPSFCRSLALIKVTE